MGIINHGILGGIKGSIGNVSGQKSKGRNVLTIKPDMSNVVKSSIQVVNNDKFNVLRRLYLNSNETINKITCANNPYKEAGYNFFSRKNYDNLTSDNIVSVDSIFIGNSGLPRVQILTAKYNSAHTSMTVTYSTSTFNVYGAGSKTYCCLYDATNIILYCLPTNYNFFSGTFIVDLPNNEIIDFSNLYVSVIASSNTDSKKFSTTLNNWILSTISVSSFKWLSSPLIKRDSMRAGYLYEGIDYEGGSFAANGFVGNINGFTYKDSNERILFAVNSTKQYFDTNFLLNVKVNSSLIGTTALLVANPELLPSRGSNSSFCLIYNKNLSGGISLAGYFGVFITFGTVQSFIVEGVYDRKVVSGYNAIVYVSPNNSGKPVFFKATVKWSQDPNTYVFYMFRLA